MQPDSRISTRILFIAASALVVSGIAASVSGGVFAESSPDPSSPEFFKQRVEPILDDNCYSCHQDSQSGGLRLDSYASILKGGKSGSPIVPGDPETSLLIKMIRRNGKLKMPPKS